MYPDSNLGFGGPRDVSSEACIPVWVFIGASRASLDGFISHLNATFKLTALNTPQTAAIGINYTYLQASDEVEWGLHPSKLNLYSIIGPLPKLETSTYLSKLLQLIPTNSDTHIIYCLDVESTWCDITDLFKSKNTVVTKDDLLKILKSTFTPIIPLSNWKSCSVVLTNTQVWNYGSLNMPNVDFIQQVLRSLLLSSNKNSENNNRLIYIPRELDFNSVNPIVELIKSLITNTPLHNDKTFISKYCDLQIDSKFDSITKIKLLDDSFNWQGDWKSSWEVESPITIENFTEDSDKSHSTNSNQPQIESQTFKQYYQESLQKLILKQSQRTN